MQLSLLAGFSFFSFFNYLYGFASLIGPRLKRVNKTSDRTIAIVIVAYNEENVLEDTIRACKKLSYKNKIIILADDSTNPEISNKLRKIALNRGCIQNDTNEIEQVIPSHNGDDKIKNSIEILESPSFVYFHREKNLGFKAGSLEVVMPYLDKRGIKLMYLLDADWHPQQDALERTLEVMEAEENIAFVQTKRLTNPKGLSVFQKYITLIEEGCYYVDFEGRQVLNHPTLFSGCCTLFRIDAINVVGGFTPGHLTEDLDLSNRLWLAGWKGKYLSNVVNYGEVPFTYDDYRRQQERWASGSSRSLREFFMPILLSEKLNWIEKLSIIRQNAYFITTVMTGIAILLGFISLAWLTTEWNTFAVEMYLLRLAQIKEPFLIILYACVIANFLEPVIMVFKSRKLKDIFLLPMMIWYAWGVLPTYVIGNLKGLFSVYLGWFRTPKYNRKQTKFNKRTPSIVRIVNTSILLALIIFYFVEGYFFGWIDVFAIILIPSFILASIK